LKTTARGDQEASNPVVTLLDLPQAQAADPGRARQYHALSFGAASTSFNVQEGFSMFPEYRDLITQLKGHDAHFTRLFDKHNDLDQQIKNKEAHIQPGTALEIEQLKKEKLLLKDQLYGILRQASA